MHQNKIVDAFALAIYQELQVKLNNLLLTEAFFILSNFSQLIPLMFLEIHCSDNINIQLIQN